MALKRGNGREDRFGSTLEDTKSRDSPPECGEQSVIM